MRNKHRTRYKEGSRIEAEGIGAQARRIFTRREPRKRDGKTVQVFLVTLEGTAYCVIETQPAPGFLRGDALEAEKIAAQSNRVRWKGVTRGSSTHNIQTIQLRGQAFCVIERALKYVRKSIEAEKSRADKNP